MPSSSVMPTGRMFTGRLRRAVLEPRLGKGKGGTGEEGKCVERKRVVGSNDTCNDDG